MNKLYKAKRIRDTYKTILINYINTKELPIFLETYANRILAIELFIIDLKYS